MRRCLFLLLIVFLASACSKYRESQRSHMPGTCEGPPIEADLYFAASTHVISFSGEISSAQVGFVWAISDPENSVEFQEGFLKTLEINPDGLHPIALTAANEGTYSWLITRAGTFRATLSATTCQGQEITRQDLIAVKVTFAPIFTVNFVPNIKFAVNVGTTVVARMAVADRDGSRRYKLSWDFVGDGRRGAAGTTEWNLDDTDEIEKSFEYKSSGILVFSAVVTDEQGDTTRYSAPVLVGAPLSLLSSNSTKVIATGVASLSVTMPARSKWAVATAGSGLRIFQLEGDGRHVRSLGQFHDSERPGILARDIAVDNALGIGYLAVADQGVYIVDMRNTGEPGFFSPPLRFTPSSRVGIGIDIQIVRLVDHGKFLLIVNSATSELYIVRIDRPLLKTLVAANKSLASGYCEITKGGVAAPCTQDSLLLDSFPVGIVTSLAWIPPYLALAGNREKFRLYRADQALTTVTPAGGYVLTEIDTGFLPTISDNLYENRSSAITGQTLVSPADTVELYVGHQGHGMALYRINNKTDQLSAPLPPYDNFYAFRKEGLLGGKGYDSFEQLFMDRGRVAIGEFGGSDRSSILLFSPAQWYARPSTWGYFHYEYVQKCNPNDLAGLNFTGDKLYEPLSYLEDCIVINTPSAMAVTSGEVAVLSQNSMQVLSLGAPVAVQGDSTSRLNIPFPADLFAYDVSGGTAVLARGAAGIELWRLDDVVNDLTPFPRLYDGWIGDEVVEDVHFASGGTSTVWALQGRKLVRYDTDFSGELLTAPTAQQTFAWHPNRLVWGASQAWSIINDEGAIVGYQLWPLPVTLNGTQTLSDRYVDLVTGGPGQLLATRSLTDGVRFDLLAADSLAVKTSLDRNFDFVMPRAVMNGRGDVMFVLSVVGSDDSEEIAIETWKYSADKFELRVKRVLPVSSQFSLELTDLQAMGDLVGILLKGRNRGMFFFQTDAKGELAYIGANLTVGAYRMSDFRLFDALGDIGILAHATDGASGGKFNLFRMKLGN